MRRHRIARILDMNQLALSPPTVGNCCTSHPGLQETELWPFLASPLFFHCDGSAEAEVANGKRLARNESQAE